MTPQKNALITGIIGITGQDGSYLAELLLEKGYVVHDIRRSASSFNTVRIDHLYQDPHLAGTRLLLHYGDLTDSSNLIRIIQRTQPDEIYNLGAQSHVAVSFESPVYTTNVVGMGNLSILEAIRILRFEKNPILPGQHQRALWPGARNPAKGNHSFLPAQPLRRRQTLCLLDHRQLP